MAHGFVSGVWSRITASPIVKVRLRCRNGAERAVVGLAVLFSMLIALGCGSARAKVSAEDGYGPNGAYQVHVELIPYVWLRR